MEGVYHSITKSLFGRDLTSVKIVISIASLMLSPADPLSDLISHPLFQTLLYKQCQKIPCPLFYAIY